jgi:hypothetical protein
MVPTGRLGTVFYTNNSTTSTQVCEATPKTKTPHIFPTEGILFPASPPMINAPTLKPSITNRGTGGLTSQWHGLG